MNQPKTVQEELGAMLDRSAMAFREAMCEIAVSVVNDSGAATARAQERFRQLAGYTMALADLMAQHRVMLWARYAGDSVAATARPALLAKDWFSPIVPHVPFKDAIAHFVSRVPELAHTAAAVTEAYLRHAIAFAYSATRVVTEKVQAHLTQFMREGRTVDEAVKEIQADAGDWTRAYAETVYRTNVHSAYSSGEIKRGLEPVTLRLLPAWELSAVGDVDTRPNHQAASGLIAAKHDPVWQKLYTPLGYNCRCSCRDVDVTELEDMGRLTLEGSVRPYYPPGVISGAAHPDEHFERRIIW
jgi:SPP1 gp7 family putative phage head morphogenesis protein